MTATGCRVAPKKRQRWVHPACCDHRGRPPSTVADHGRALFRPPAAHPTPGSELDGACDTVQSDLQPTDIDGSGGL